jgi:pimeloyl-ACP methyl ester carboxylesterase
MIARLLRWLLLLQLATVGALASVAMMFWHFHSWTSALALGVLVVVSLRAWITVQNFGLSWHYRSATPAQYRLRLMDRCRMVFNEFVATLLASCWTMAWPGKNWHLASQANGLPVLLVHGYACNSGYWAQLSCLLERERISHHAIDLAPLGAAIDDYVPQLHSAIEELCARTGRRELIIVAHSMGGLVARAYLRAHGSERIARVITLGTPHHGTSLAQFGIGRNTRQMQRRGGCVSDWLALLAASEGAAQRALLTSIFSHHDNIIAPQTSCRLPGAKNIEFGAVGHVAMGRDRRILQCVLDEIQLVGRARTAAIVTDTPGAAHDVCGASH